MTGLSVAIIPARNGSKRLANKNLKPLCGKPMILWTIEAALASCIFDIVLVTTDGEEIAAVSRTAGAEVPFLRPSELATDSASTNDVISHAVAWIEANRADVSRVTLLQPTSPLRDADNIRGAMALYEEKKASAVISVCPMEHPIQFCNTLPADLTMAGFLQPANNKRTQDLTPYYRLNGAIYIFDRHYVNNLSSLYSQNAYAYIMEKSRSIDIDEELDFIFAETILSMR